MDEVVAGSLAPPAWYDRKRVVQLVAFVAALVGAIAVLVLPVYSVVGESSGGQVVESTRTLLAVNGFRVIGLVVIPVLLAGIPLLMRGRARALVSVAAVLLVAFAVVSGFSIGVFFLMAATCAVVALFVPASRRRSAD